MVVSSSRFSSLMQLSNSLRQKITRIDVDVNAVINSNRKQAHQSHTPHYEKYIEFFVQLYSIINTNMFFFLELLLFCPVKLCGSRQIVVQKFDRGDKKFGKHWYRALLIIICPNNRCPGRDSNWASPKQKSITLPLDQPPLSPK
jgi:hypothetical protein